MSNLRSIQRVVLATDGSVHAEATLAFINALAWQSGETTIWVTTVVDVPAPSEQTAGRLMAKGLADWRRVLELAHNDARDRASGVVGDAARRLRERHPGVVVEEVVRVGEPAAELLAQIDAVRADLVVAGARGHTVLHGLLLGSVSEALVTSAPCPVLIVREVPATFDTVLVAVRTAEDADRLADLCLRLPLPPATRLVAVTVGAPLPAARTGSPPFADDRIDQVLHEWEEEDRDESEAVGRRFVERIGAGSPGRTVEIRVVRGVVNPSLFDVRGDIAPAILREATDRGAALTIIGAREAGGVAARLGLGSVSRKLVRRASGAVLVLREPVGPE